MTKAELMKRNEEQCVATIMYLWRDLSFVLEEEIENPDTELVETLFNNEIIPACTKYLNVTIELQKVSVVDNKDKMCEIYYTVKNQNGETMTDLNLFSLIQRVFNNEISYRCLRNIQKKEYPVYFSFNLSK